MTSMRTLVIFWVSGVIAGIVLMERWRRHGGRYIPVEATTPESAIGAPVPSRPRTTNVVGLVVAGAKLDAQRVKTQVVRIRTSHT